MANIINALERVNFRHVNNIDELTDSELEEKGYYRGFSCVHGHTCLLYTSDAADE